MSKELLAILLPLILQYTPTAIKDITQLVEGNPQKAGEVDSDYIARLGAQIDANDASIAEQDKEIQS